MTSNVSARGTIDAWFIQLLDKVQRNEILPYTVRGPLGPMDVRYDRDEQGIYVVLQYTLPEGVMVQFDDGTNPTFGDMGGFRIPITEQAAVATTDHGYTVELDRGELHIHDQDGNTVDVITRDNQDGRYEHLLRVVIEASQ